jgi:hypothetical protein
MRVNYDHQHPITLKKEKNVKKGEELKYIF